MAADREARTNLRNALARYMTGAIHTFAFDDANSDCAKSTDAGVQEISQFLYNIHDDTLDHPISVTWDGWTALRRILAFLDTDLDIETTPEQPTRPFRDDEQWYAYKHRVNDMRLPEYDPTIHAQQIHPWWNRIPSSVGFAILAGLVVVTIAVFLLW